MYAEHIQALESLLALQEILLADVANAVPIHPEDRTPASRRHYVRAGFAMVEGVTAAWRRVALAAIEAGMTTTAFSAGEISLLRGETYELDDTGVVKSRPRFQQLTRSVRFSFRAFAKAYDLPFQLDISGNGWRCFREAVKVRNRLTHPKFPEDLEVSQNDIVHCGEAFEWFRSEAERKSSLLVEMMRTSSVDEE